MICNIIFRFACQSLAYVEQFTFLSAMTWQSQIGHHNIQTLKGLSDVNNVVKPVVLSRTHLALGYGLPTLWSLVTASAELIGPRCADYKPRFGERSVQILITSSHRYFQNLFLLWKEGQIYLVLSPNSGDAGSKLQIFQLLHKKNMEVYHTDFLYFL